MKKLLIIAVASSFLFISCSKETPTQPAQPKTPSAVQNEIAKEADVVPGPPAPLTAEQYVITNVETNLGLVPYSIRFLNASTGQFQTVTVRMGQSVTICLHDAGNFTANFAFTIRYIGNC
jgi:hypothetical protein